MSSNHGEPEQDNPDPPPSAPPPPPAAHITAGEAAREAKLGAIRGGTAGLIMLVFSHLP